MMATHIALLAFLSGLEAALAFRGHSGSAARQQHLSVSSLPLCKDVAPNFPALTGGCNLEVSGSACYSKESTYKVPGQNESVQIEWACSPNKDADSTITDEKCQERTWNFNNGKVQFVAPRGIYAGACLLSEGRETEDTTIPDTTTASSASTSSSSAAGFEAALAFRGHSDFGARQQHLSMSALPLCKDVAPNFPAFAGGCNLDVSGSACYSKESTYKVPGENESVTIEWACSPNKDADNSITDEKCQERTWNFDNGKVKFVAPKGVYAGACLLTPPSEAGKIEDTTIPDTTTASSASTSSSSAAGAPAPAPTSTTTTAGAASTSSTTAGSPDPTTTTTTTGAAQGLFAAAWFPLLALAFVQVFI